MVNYVVISTVDYVMVNMADYSVASGVNVVSTYT